MKFLKIILTLLSFTTLTANAGIPDEYSPVVIEPPFSFSKRLIDLTESVNKSKATGKPILLYFGAADCPPCKQYEQFLSKNVAQMKPVLSEFVVADVRSWLKGPSVYIRVNNEDYPFKEWRGTTGDTREGLFWPTWWILSSDLKQLKQLPSGSGSFLNVKRHTDILNLVN